MKRSQSGTVLPRASAVLLFVIAACGPDGPDAYLADASAPETRPAAGPPSTVDYSAEPVAPNGETVDVQAIDNSFRAAMIEVVAGTEVRWENRGRNDHDVLPVDENSTWGVDAEGFVPGDEYATVFDRPGTFAYYCSIHGTKEVGMIGTVVVLPADS